MSNETVIYENELNLIPLKDFNSVEIDLFFTICNKLKEKETEELELPFDDLKRLSNYNQTQLKRFTNDLKHVYDKVLKLTYTEYSGLSFETFVLFTGYKVDVNTQTLTISINPKLKYILNNITGNFTKFELQELVNIKSTYAKNMFRILKQYKHTGYFKIKTEDFRERLDVPKSYRMSDINKTVFTPIINELLPLFPNLRINKIKAKKGRKIEWIEFTFEKEQRAITHNHPQRSTDGQNSKSGSKYSKPIKSREKTPQWIEERDNKKLREDTTDEKLEEDRKAFLKQLEKDWEEE